MRFSYLVLADAVTGAEGKTNLLGVGARVVTREDPETPISLGIAGAVEGLPDEGGDYDLRVWIEEPGGQESTLAEANATLPGSSDYEGLPTSSVFIITLTRPYRLEGLHVLRATFGTLEASYPFFVRTNPTSG